MIRMLTAAALAAATLHVALAKAEDVAPSAERGRHVAIVGGCNDCHTAGYAESNGRLDASIALTGSPLGFRGPWGTTYPTNLRIVAAGLDQDGFVAHLKSLQSRPPMPWFNLKEMEDRDLASLFLYIRGLGEPGSPAPDYVAPDDEPRTPYIVFAPPTMPK